MADKTYDINISGAAAGSAGGGARKPPETASMQRLLKALEALARGQKSDIAKDLKPLFEKLVAQIARQQAAGGPKKVTQAEVRGIAGELASEIAKQISRQLTKVYTNVKAPTGGPATADAKKITDAISRGLDKQAQSIIGSMTTMLSRKGVSVGQQDVVKLQKEISDAIKRTVTAKGGAEVKEIAKSVGAMKNVAAELSRLVKTIGGIRKSGGGIDITEIKDAVTTIGKINKELKTFKDSASSASEAIKKIPGDVKGIKDALGDVRGAVGRQVRGVKERAKEDPKEFARLVAKSIGDVLEKSPVFKESGAGKSWKELENTTKSIKDVADKLNNIQRDITKSIKAGEIPAADIKQLIGVLSKQIAGPTAARGQAPGWYAEKEPPPEFFKAGKKVVQTLEIALEDAPVKKKIKDIAKFAKDEVKSKLEEGISEVDVRPLTKKFTAQANTLKKEFENVFKDIEKTSTAYFARRPRMEEKVAEGRKALRAGDPEAAIKKIVQVSQMADLEELKKPIENLKGAVLKYTDDIRKASIDPKKAKGWLAPLDDLTKETKAITKEAEGVKKLLSEKKKELKKSIAEEKKIRTPVKPPTTLAREDEMQIRRDKVRFLQSQPKRFPEEVIRPGEQYKFKGSGTGYGKETRQAVEDKMTALSQSLDVLQKTIIKQLEESFQQHRTGWAVVDDSFKKIGDQWKLQIANVKRMSTALATAGQAPAPGATPEEILKKYKTVEISRLTGATTDASAKAQKIGEWIRKTSEDDIKAFRKTLGDVTTDILMSAKIETAFQKGEAVSSEMASMLENRLGNAISTVFEKTFATSQVESIISDRQLERTVALPAAQVSKTGAAIFKTKHGSERALPKFATYKTGFEEIYDMMTSKGLFPEKGEHPIAEEIQKIGFRPAKTGRLPEAKQLAEKLMSQLAGAGEGKFVMEQYKEAITMAGTKRQRAGVESAADYERRITAAMQDAPKAMNEFMKYMEDIGISAYDVIKSMESIRFENVYDVFKKVLEGTKGGRQPLAGLGQRPDYESKIRGFEQAIRSVEQLTPMIEPSKVKRGKHYEDLVVTMFQTSPVWEKSKFVKKGRGGLTPEDQKQRIQDINMNIREVLKEYEELINVAEEISPGMVKRRAKLQIPGDIRTISSLGIPEAQAASYEEYRRGAPLPKEQQFLESLGATSIKLYSEKLLEQAPFGEFGRLGRNIANVSAAMTSMEKDMVRGIKGVTTEFPSLRTTRERDITAAGRYGEAGYGFNVLAELRHTAGTFEDQIIVSGKLAEALTQAVSGLVKPSLKGRLGAPVGSRGYVSEMEPQILRDVTDKQIGETSRKFMEILGRPEEYTKEADKALIEEVKKVLTTVVGEDVEVQKGKLAEVFMSHFGRKFVTRHGTKGLSVRTAGPEGLGFAEIPKSMGELGKELLEFIEKDKDLMKKATEFAAPEIRKKGFESLKGELAESGNKFILDLFSDVTNEMARSLGVEEEIEKQAEIYKRFTAVIKNVFEEELPRDIKGVAALKKLYTGKIGEEGLVTQKPIDIRISAAGIAKRGLQSEFIETIMGSVAGVGPGGATTIQPTLTPALMQGLLGTREQAAGGGIRVERGLLSQYSQALGYQGVEQTQKQIEEELMATGMEEVQAKRAAALEAMSNYYSNIKDIYGKQAKAIVGPKFVQIVEEPHQVEGWSERGVEELKKGTKLNLPAYAAYAAIFGEKSPMMEQIKGVRGRGAGGATEGASRQFEYIKALQALNTSKIGKAMADDLMASAKPVRLEELAKFEERTGTFRTEQDVQRSLKETILDVEKYPTPLMVELPKKRGAEPGTFEKEPFYIPGPLARQTYPEELIAGEMGMDLISRRLQDVINKAKAVETGATDVTAEKSLEELDSLLRTQVGKLVAEGTGGVTSKERKEEIIRQLYEGLKDVPVEEAYRAEREKFSGKTYAQGITEKEYAGEYLSRMKARYEAENKTIDEAYERLIGRLGDILIGPQAGRLKGTPSRLEKVVGTGRKESVEGLVKDLGLERASEEEIDKRLIALQKAKVRYMKDLTDVVLGKEGAIGESIFLRKIPSAMAKTVAGITDKTDELEQFSKDLRAISKEFGGLADEIKGMESLGQMATVIDEIQEEHAKAIDAYTELGLPVLKQHELGIPKRIAKKIPVTFEKKFKSAKGAGLFPLEKPETVETGDLAQMLGYREMLERGLKKTPEEYQAEIRKHMEEDLQPYIESLRYPFTGISSVQPYKAKLLEPTRAEGGRDVSQFALAVPGIPEMRMLTEKQGDVLKEGFIAQIDKLEAMKEEALKARETLRTEYEDMGKEIPADKLQALSSLIDRLNQVISDVIPKYVAVQQKLDFDGDMIQIHSGVLSDARQEIERHYKSMVEYRKGRGTTGQAWRDQWTYGENVPSTSGRFPLADIMQQYEKKWKPEKGYEFLLRPEITEKLDYISSPEQLEFLAGAKTAGKPGLTQATAMEDIIKGVISEAVTEKGPREQMLAVINETVAKGNTSAIELLEAIKALDSNFGMEMSKLVTAGIKEQLYEQKYGDAIVAQLFKLHTGMETESLYRLHRLAERRVGFGGGMADPRGGGYRSSEEFKKRWPAELKIFGGIAPESELHTFINELERFATQKGMDVKLAGEKPVAGEIARSLAKGASGVSTLLGELGKADLPDSDSDYKQLADFVNISNKVIKERLGTMATADIMSDVKKLASARGVKLPEIKSRKDALNEAVKLIGFEAFLMELAEQLQEDAVDALTAHIESLAPRAKSTRMRGQTHKTAREFAEGEIKWQMEKGPGIRTKDVMEEAMPLYSFRGAGSSQAAMAGAYRQTSLQAVEVPEEIAAIAAQKGSKEFEESNKRLVQDYKRAQEISRSIQRTLQEATQRKGAGAYTDMVMSTLENIYEDQERIEGILQKLESEGYPVGERRGMGEIAARMVEPGMPGIPSITQELIGPTTEKLEEAGAMLAVMRKRVDEYSRLAGIPDLGEAAKRDIEIEFAAPEFTALAKKRFEGQKGADEKINKYVELMQEKAGAVAQMDKVIEAFQTRAKEGEFIKQLLPPKEAIRQIAEEQAIKTKIAMPRRELLTERARQLATGVPGAAGGARGLGREEDILMPPGGRRPGDGGGIMGIGPGDVVDVRIVEVVEGIGLTFTPAGTMQSAVEAARAGTAPVDDVAELKRLQEKASGVGETMKATYKDIYRASALFGGGRYKYSGPLKGETFKTEQVGAIKRQMMGAKEDIPPRAEAAGFLGTVLHKEIQAAAKKKLEQETGGAATYDIERFVLYQDQLAGAISGHVDLIHQKFDDAGNAMDEKVVDIKTVSKGMVDRFKKLGVTRFEKIGDVKKEEVLTAYDAKKLEEVASQINLYIAAIAQANDVAAESLQGEAWFYDREDIKNIAKIKFSFDPERLERDMESINAARQGVIGDYGEQAFAKAQSFVDLQRADQERRAGKETLDPSEWRRFGDLASKQYEKTKYTSDWQFREKDIEFPKRVRSYADDIRKSRFDEYDIPSAPATGGRILDVFENLKIWHEAAKDYASEVSKISFEGPEYGQVDARIRDMLGDMKKEGPKGMEFSELITDLKEAEYIKGPDIAKAWKLYRIAVGDFFLEEAARADKMESEFKAAGKPGEARTEYNKMKASLDKMKAFIEKGLGKPSDIYTSKRRYHRPDIAQELGLLLSPRQLMERSQAPFDSDKLKGLFEKTLVGDVEKEGKLTPPIEKVREVVKSLSGADEAMIDILTDAEKFERMGDEVKEAWNLNEVYEGVVKLRSALQSFLRFKFTEGEDLVERANLQETVKLLKNIEAAYARVGGQKDKAFDWGEMGITKVPGVLAPKEQEAMHMKNLQRVREYFKLTEEEGGARKGERFIYPIKIMGESGEIIKNAAYDFRKLGDVVNFAGEKVGRFGESFRDTMEFMQGGNRSLTAAIYRAARWGAASKLVYGGWQQIWDSVGILADIETGMAQLRMVMSPLETDFNAMGEAAVTFAKQYGVSIEEVLRGMKIFAQQGLGQEEVIDRTRTATLASNVTTLNAKEATEALTAAMKIYGEEGESALRFLDSWSEVEARHAITAGDMANAIKKSAAAAKNAGITFDELNGIITGIGTVTRQTGKEVSTALRFMFRRLYSDKAPKELAQLGIPVLTGGAELRTGIDILGDLAMKWKDLTSAQKMNIAQSIGGVRQYNALLVLMDNWKEATAAITHSINSKGSAERRNMELMKTYNKQLEQTKAAAVEVQMAFGKIAMPTFKFVLKGVKTALEAFSAIPGPVKAAMAAVTAFFAFIAKGDVLLEKGFDFVLGGKSTIGQVVKSLHDEFRVAGFEMLGRGAGEAWTKGLKTVTEKGDDTKKGERMADFQSALGKSQFLIMTMGQWWNRMMGDVIVGSSDMANAVDKTVQRIGKGMQVLGSKPSLKGIKDLIEVAKSGATGPGGIAKAALGFGVYAAGEGMEKMSEVVIGGLGDLLGTGGHKALTDWASANAGVVESILPMIATMGALYLALDKSGDYFNKITKNALDYEKSMYGARRASDAQISSIKALISNYSNLETAVDEYNKLQDPAVAGRRQELGTYQSPLLKMEEILKGSIKYANKLAKENLNLVAGYDEMGNAILRNVDSYQKFSKISEKVAKEERARMEVGIAGRFARDITEKGGPEKWKSRFQKVLKELPLGFGKIASDLIKVSPAKVLDDLIQRLNKLISIKHKYPMSTAVDEDIKRLQKGLDEAKKLFNEMYSDFGKTIKGIDVEGLDKSVIADIFASEELRKGYELMLKVEPRFRVVKGITPEDIMGTEALKGIAPKFATYIDAAADLTKARFQTSMEQGVKGIEPTKELFVGRTYLATFAKDAAEAGNMAGDQAIITWKKNIDGVYEAVATYFNTKTLKIEERPFDEAMQNITNQVFPAQRLREAVSDDIDQFNEFVAGAAAGLKGIAAKDFKRDFTLGERFFGEVPTTTLLQGTKGYAPYAGGYGESPFQKGWAEDIKKAFFEPMEEYRKIVADYSKLQLEGISGQEVEIDPKTIEQLEKLQTILKNNQIVFQFNAAWADVTKTIAENMRVLKESIAVEKERLNTVKVVSGQLAGISEDLVADLDLGIRRREDLSPHQMALTESPVYERGAKLYKELDQYRRTVIGNNEALVKAGSAIDNIREYSKAFGTELEPGQLEKFAEKVAILGDVGAADISLQTSKVAENTAKANVQLEDILQALDPKQTEAWITQQGVGADKASDKLKALERLATRRTYEQKAGNMDMVIAANKQIDVVSRGLVQQVGLTKAMGMVGKNQTLFNKDFKQAELLQRAIPVGREELSSLLRQRLTGEEIMTRKEVPDEKYGLGMLAPAPFGRRNVAERMSAIQTDSAKMLKLEESATKKGLLDSKTVQKAQAAALVYYSFNKKYSNAAIKKYDDQIKVAEAKVEEAVMGDAGEEAVRGFVQEVEALKEAREKEQKAVNLYGMVQAFSAVGLGASTLSRILGLTEKQIKTMGLGAMGTYAAFKVLSMITGGELPDSAKEFGKTLKSISKEIVEKGSFEDVSTAAKAGFKKTATAFQEDFKKNVSSELKKDLKKVDVEKLQESFVSISKSMEDREEKLSEYKALGPKFKAYAELYEKQLTEKVAKYKEVGFAGRGYQDLLREHDRQVFDFMKKYDYEVQDNIIGRFPIKGAGVDYYEDVKSMYAKEGVRGQKGVKEAGRDVFFEGRADDAIIRKAVAIGVAGMASTLTGYMIDEGRADYNTMYAQAEEHAQALLELQKEHPEVFEELVKELYKVQEAAGKGLIPTESVNKALEVGKKYTDVQSFVNQALEEGRNKLLATDSVMKALNDTLASLQNEVGVLNRDFEAFNAELKSLHMKEFTESLSGVKEFREEMSKLFGGGHPEARMAVSVAQEREAARGGITLRHLGSTKYDIQRGALQAQQMKEGFSPERYQQIQDIEEQRRRDVEVHKQTQANQKLISQVGVYEKQLERLGVLAMEVDLSEEAREKIELLRNNIADMLADAADMVSQKEALAILETGKGTLTKKEYEEEKARIMAAGPTQYKGFTATGVKEIREAMSAIQKEAQARQEDTMKRLEERTKEISDTLETGVISTELQTQTGLLQQLVDQMPEVTFTVPDNKQAGGLVAGTGKGDKYPHMLEAGEYVIRKDAAQKIGHGLLDQLNSGAIRFAQAGGMVTGYSPAGVASPRTSDQKELLEETRKQSEHIIRTADEIRILREKGFKEGMAEVAKENTLQTLNESVKALPDSIPSPTGDLGPPINVEEVVNTLISLSEKLSGKLDNVVSEIKGQTSTLSQKLDALTPAGKEAVKGKDVKAGTVGALRGYVGSVWDDDKKAIGGRIFGEGGPKADKIPAMLSAGEYVIKTDSAKRLGYDALEYMNTQGKVPGFNAGGMVGPFGQNVKNIDEFVKVLEEARMGLAGKLWDEKESKAITGNVLKQIGLAASELGVRYLVKAPAELLAMPEAVLTSIGDVGVLDTLGKGYDMAKALFSQQGLEGMADMVKENVKKGGLGVTAAVMELATGTAGAKAAKEQFSIWQTIGKARKTGIIGKEPSKAYMKKLDKILKKHQAAGVPDVDPRLEALKGVEYPETMLQLLDEKQMFKVEGLAKQRKVSKTDKLKAMIADETGGVGDVAELRRARAVAVDEANIAKHRNKIKTLEDELEYSQDWIKTPQMLDKIAEMENQIKWHKKTVASIEKTAADRPPVVTKPVAGVAPEPAQITKAGLPTTRSQKAIADHIAKLEIDVKDTEALLMNPKTASQKLADKYEILVADLAEAKKKTAVKMFEGGIVPGFQAGGLQRGFRRPKQSGTSVYDPRTGKRYYGKEAEAMAKSLREQGPAGEEEEKRSAQRKRELTKQRDSMTMGAAAYLAKYYPEKKKETDKATKYFIAGDDEGPIDPKKVSVSKEVFEAHMAKDYEKTLSTVEKEKLISPYYTPLPDEIKPLPTGRIGDLTPERSRLADIDQEKMQKDFPYTPFTSKFDKTGVVEIPGGIGGKPATSERIEAERLSGMGKADKLVQKAKGMWKNILGRDKPGKKEIEATKMGILPGLGTMAEMMGKFLGSPTVKSILDLYEGSDLTTALDIYMPFGEGDIKKDIEEDPEKAVSTMMRKQESVSVEKLTKDLDPKYKHRIPEVKSIAQINEEQWAIKSTTELIKRMHDEYAGEKYQKEILSYYPEDVLKQSLKEYVLKFGKEEGYRLAMLGLGLEKPDPTIFKAPGAGKSFEKAAFMPWQAETKIKEGIALAERRKEKLDLARLNRPGGEFPVTFRTPGGDRLGEFYEKRDLQTGLTGDPGDPIRYQAVSAANILEHFTKEEIRSMMPEKSSAAMADPRYAAKIAAQKEQKRKLQEDLTEADPGSDAHELIQEALEALRELETMHPKEKKWWRFWEYTPERHAKAYAKKYKKFAELVAGKDGILYDEKGVIDIETIAEKRMFEKAAAVDPLELDIDTGKEEIYLPKAKKYAQMHLRARNLWDTYEDTLKARYGQQDLDYKGKDKGRFQDDLKFRRDTLMKQLLFTNAILSKIGEGGDIADLKTLVSGRTGGRMQALRNKWGAVEETSLAAQALHTDATLIRTFKTDERMAREARKKGGWWGSIKEALGMVDGGRTDSMRAMHHGGFVTKTGPAFLQKGEVVFPKSFQEGGPVHGEVSKLLEKDLPSLQDITIKIDTSELKSLLNEKLQIEDKELTAVLADDTIVEAKLADDSVVSVDPTSLEGIFDGVILPIEDREFTAVLADSTVTVEFDSATIARDISSAVATAVSDITVTAEVTGGAVGADEATVAAAIDSMDAKLVAMKGDLEDKISVVGQVDTNEIMRNVEVLVNNVVNNTVLEIRSVESTIDNLRSEVQREKDLAVYIRSDFDRRIAEVYNTIL